MSYTYTNHRDRPSLPTTSAGDPASTSMDAKRRRRRVRRGYVPSAPYVTLAIVAAAVTALAMGVFVVVPATVASEDAYTYVAMRASASEHRTVAPASSTDSPVRAARAHPA